MGPGGFVMPRWRVAPLVFRRRVWPHGCSGRRRARPPARSPHASLRLGVVDLEARPCPPDPPAPFAPVGPCCAVGGSPPASRPRCELRSARRLEARPCPPDPPVPFAPVVPGVLACGSMCCLGTRPGLAARRHRGQVPPSRGTRIRRSLPTFLSRTQFRMQFPRDYFKP